MWKTWQPLFNIYDFSNPPQEGSESDVSEFGDMGGGEWADSDGSDEDLDAHLFQPVPLPTTAPKVRAHEARFLLQ